MKTFGFYKITAIIIFVCVVVVALLVFLNLNSAPRITTVQYISRSVDESNLDRKSVSDLQIRVYFNRPMSKTDLKDLVTLTPADTEYSSNWFGNGFVINFKESLSYSQHYNIDIKPEFADTYGVKVQDTLKLNFTTKSPTLAYIERLQDGTSEKIVSYNLETRQKQTIFTNKTIKYFKNIRNIFGIVTSNGNKDNFIIYDSESNRVLKDFELNSHNISDIEADPYNLRFAIIMQEIEDKDRYFVPVTNTKIYLASIESLDLNEMVPLDSAQGYLDIEFNKDYSGLIFKLPDSLYYVVDISNLQNLSNLGKYLYFGNFSKDGGKAVLLEYDPLATENPYQYIVTLDAERNKTNLTNGEYAVIDPLFMNKTDEIVFAEFNKEIIGTKGIYKLSKISSDGKLTGLLALDNISIEYPVSSLDDKYIAAETFTVEQLLNFEKQRNFGFQTKPYTSEIIIFETSTSKLKKDQLFGAYPTFLD